MLCSGDVSLAKRNRPLDQEWLPAEGLLSRQPLKFGERLDARIGALPRGSPHFGHDRLGKTIGTRGPKGLRGKAANDVAAGKQHECRGGQSACDALQLEAPPPHQLSGWCASMTISVRSLSI